MVHPGESATGLAVSHLASIADKLIGNSLAASSRKTYSSAQAKHLNFCSGMCLAPIPASQQQLILFSQTVTYATMRTYLSAVRHLDISEGHRDPLEGSLQLSLLMKGARRTKPAKGDQRLPITPLILNKMYEILNQEPQKYENKLLWAACCLGFFAFLGSGEFTIKPGEDFDPTWHLTINDISVDSLTDPSKIQIHIKGSKTDQWRKIIHLLVGRTDSHLCAVKAILTYIAARGFRDGPLFINIDGSPFTQQQLILSLRNTLTKAGIDCTHYSCHSFRIGTATTAAAKGISDATIPTLGIDGVVTRIKGTLGCHTVN